MNMSILTKYLIFGLLVMFGHICSCNCALTRNIRSVQNTSFSNNFDMLRCAAQGADSAYAAVRAGVNTDVCDPVTVLDFKTNGTQPGYNYLLKTEFIKAFSPGANQHVSEVPGSVKLGAIFEFKIQANGARQFIINLYNLGTQNRMLHFRSRATNCIFNTRISGSYGTEETVSNHAFSENRLYIVRFTMTDAHIQADVDGSHYYTYDHRLNFTEITHVHFVSMSDTLTLMEQQKVLYSTIITV